MGSSRMATQMGQHGYFLLYYLRTLFGRRMPLLGGVKLTHRCNLRCCHCPFWRKEKGSLSFAQLRSCLGTLYDWGVRLLIMEGGEPFLWREGEYDLHDAVREAKKRFFSVSVTTNGTFPLDIEADNVWVSIDGLEETHDRIRGPSFGRIMANIDASSHPSIYAHITINSLNWREIPELVRFLSGRVKGITVQFVDSYACLAALKDNRWRCRPWMIASVDPDGELLHGCYVKGRGQISCERCGFSAHTEMSLAYAGVLESILVGSKVFGARTSRSSGKGIGRPG